MSEKKDYQTLSTELNEVLEQLQSADLDIDAAVKLYDRGMILIDALDGYLKDAENKITKIQKQWDKAA